MMHLFEKFMNIFKLHKTLCAVVGQWRANVGQKTPASPVINKPIDYVINDLSSPNLIKKIMPPIYSGKPLFTVKGYKGGGFLRNTVEGQAANCFVTVTNTINFFNSKSEIPLLKWPGTSNLQILPRAGMDLNAFYNRRTLSFFYYTDSRIGGSFFTCDSSDIVAHELGHAIFDSYRPQTWSAASLEVASFHEAFADLTAIMHILTYPEVLNFVIQQTQGNIKKDNLASKLAESFGIAIYKLSGPESGRLPDALRSAINNFKYVNPGSLPANAPYNSLAAECHSFGRIFLGAFYDILVMMYEDIKSTGIPPVDALAKARDLLTRYVLKAIQNAPLNVSFYNSVAKTMLWADVVLSNWKYHDRMKQIFLNRNLLLTNLMMLSAPKCENDDLIIKTQGCMNIKLEDVVVRAQSNNNPLYSVELEIPNEKTYLYDTNRNIYDVIKVAEEQSVASAIDMVEYLHNSNSVSDDVKTPFEIKDGKLVRTHFS
jgi:hypothetical protein